MDHEPDATMQPTLQDNQLMSKHHVLGFKPQLRLEWRAQNGQNETKQPDHSANLGDSITSSARIRFSVHTGLNASAGISYNKFLAKLASDHRKPNGQYVITPEMGPAFVEALPVGKFHGIGPATSAKMNALGLYTGLDMRNQSLEFMQANFGKAGSYYYWISRGVDDREVRADRIRKSIGAENTFFIDLTSSRRWCRNCSR
jgi:DNA polymerase IV